MKIYNMIEGKWLKSQKEEEDEELKQEEHKDFDVRTRLVTYDEEKEWVRAEKNCVELKKNLTSDLKFAMMNTNKIGERNENLGINH